MTNWVWIPYVIDIIGNFNVFLWVVTGSCAVSSLVIGMSVFLEESFNKYKKFLYTPSIVALVTGLMLVFIPSKETMYQMAGLGAVQTIVQSKTATKAVELAEAYLDKQLKSVKEDKK